MTPYRRPFPTSLRSTIDDGEYDDFHRMVQAACRAAVRLDEPVLSWDAPKSWRIGFKVGSYFWSIRPRTAGKTCPPELRDHLRSSAGRQRLARLMTQRALPAPFRSRYERLSAEDDTPEGQAG